VRSRPGSHWLVVATVCVGAFMGQLDASIVTVAFPTMQHDFAVPLGAVEWVALSYLLVLVSAVVGVGRLADMVGRKLLYTYGFVVFTLASLGCGLAGSLTLLIVFRLLQALGAAMLQANSVALIATSLPRSILGRGIGVQGAFQALGLALGPTVGGLLIAAGGWRWIFFVNVPAGVIGVVSAWFLLPRSRGLAARQRFDWAGLALFVPVVTALLLALSLGRDVGFARPGILILFVVAVLALVVFILWEHHTDRPMVDLRLFARVQFSAGIASGFLSYAVLFGVLFVVPFLLERGLGLSTATAGLILTVLPAALGLISPVAGRLADRTGARPLTAAGMLLTAVGLAGMAFLPVEVPVLIAALVVVGVGQGLFTAPNNAAIMAAAPRTASGSAGGLLNMTRGIGTSMGVALAGITLGGTAAHAHAGGIGHGFSATCAMLAALALLAAAIAGLRGHVRRADPGSQAH
jgi:EmrB/QacA subfamily drug resistance transporter